MILSDRDIKHLISEGLLSVTSPARDHLKNIHASSMDLRLGKYFKVYDPKKVAILDPLKTDFKNLTNLIEITNPAEPFIINPGDFVLGVTMEKIHLPSNIVARVEGRSSLGRLGIIIHSTAGFVDAGFEGTITLEITNINKIPVALYPGMRVCQLAFEEMKSPAEIPYGTKDGAKSNSKYQGQDLPEESRLNLDADLDELRIKSPV